MLNTVLKKKTSSKNIINKIFLGVLISVGFVFQTQAEVIQINSTSVKSFFDGPSDDPHIVFLQEIKKAQKSILMEMFRLTDLEIVDAMVEAKQRGVDVKVILDGSTYGSPSTVAATEKMDSGGVNWFKSSPGFSISHSKAMIIDDVEMIISSMNLSKQAENKRDWGVVLTDQEMISDVKNLFLTDIENSKTGLSNTPELKSSQLIVSPVNSTDRLMTLIKGAKKSIDITTENFTSRELMTELDLAIKRGVKVRLLTPQIPDGPPPELNQKGSNFIISAGGEAKQMPSPTSEEHPYIHGKDMIIDGQKVYLGSINLSFNSLTKARELGVVLDDPTVVHHLMTDFEEDWKTSVLPLPDGTLVERPNSDTRN